MIDVDKLAAAITELQARLAMAEVRIAYLERLLARRPVDQFFPAAMETKR